MPNGHNQNQENENELRRQVSLVTLNDDYISGVAVSAMASQEEYGRLPEAVYVGSVSNTPGELAYRSLLLQELLSDEIPDNTLKFRIKQRAKRIVNEAIDNLKVRDVFDLHGIEVNENNQQIAERYLRELDDNQRNALKHVYLASYVDARIAGYLSQRVSARVRTIEDLFSPENPEE